MSSDKRFTQEQIKAFQDPDRREALLRAVEAEASKRLAQSRYRAQFKRLLPRRFGPPQPEDAAIIRHLVYDLLFYEADQKKATFFDRLARQEIYAPSSPEAAALATFRRAWLFLGKVKARTRDHNLQLDDWNSGTPVYLSECGADIGDILVARLTTCPDGSLMALGPVLLLGVQAHAAAEDQKADLQRAASYKQFRALEKIYRTFIEECVQANLPLESSIVFPELQSSTPELSFNGRNWETTSDAAPPLPQLASLANRWATLQSPEPTRADPNGSTWLRQQAHPSLVCFIAEMYTQVRDHASQSSAVTSMAQIALETVTRRAELGLGPSFDTSQTAWSLSGNGLTEEARAFIHRIRNQITSTATISDPDLQRVVKQIQALRAKTQAKGCTEAEAMAAAEKVEELLRRYDISLSDTQLAETRCVASRIPTPRKRQDGIDLCASALAAFCDCTHWMQKHPEGHLTHVFFGLPADVTASEELFALIAATFDVETANFKKSDTYKGTDSRDRAQATKSFRQGLADGIRDKLENLQNERGYNTREATGRDLVPIKKDMIEDELDRLGLVFRSGRGSKRWVDINAYDEGVASGRAVQIG